MEEGFVSVAKVQQKCESLDNFLLSQLLLYSRVLYTESDVDPHTDRRELARCVGLETVAVGTKFLIRRFSYATLTAWCPSFGIAITSGDGVDGAEGIPIGRLRDELFEAYLQMNDIEQFFSSVCPPSLLVEACNDLNIFNPVGTIEDVKGILSDEAVLLGWENVLEVQPILLLKDMSNGWHLDGELQKEKRDLVEMLVRYVFDLPEGEEMEVDDKVQNQGGPIVSAQPKHLAKVEEEEEEEEEEQEEEEEEEEKVHAGVRFEVENRNGMGPGVHGTKESEEEPEHEDLMEIDHVGGVLSGVKEEVVHPGEVTSVEEERAAHYLPPPPPTPTPASIPISSLLNEDRHQVEEEEKKKEEEEEKKKEEKKKIFEEEKKKEEEKVEEEEEAERKGSQAQAEEVEKEVVSTLYPSLLQLTDAYGEHHEVESMETTTTATKATPPTPPPTPITITQEEEAKEKKEAVQPAHSDLDSSQDTPMKDENGEETQQPQQQQQFLPVKTESSESRGVSVSESEGESEGTSPQKKGSRIRGTSGLTASDIKKGMKEGELMRFTSVVLKSYVRDSLGLAARGNKADHVAAIIAQWAGQTQPETPTKKRKRGGVAESGEGGDSAASQQSTEGESLPSLEDEGEGKSHLPPNPPQHTHAHFLEPSKRRRRTSATAQDGEADGAEKKPRRPVRRRSRRGDGAGSGSGSERGSSDSELSESESAAASGSEHSESEMSEGGTTRRSTRRVSTRPQRRRLTEMVIQQEGEKILSSTSSTPSGEEGGGRVKRVAARRKSVAVKPDPTQNE